LKFEPGAGAKPRRIVVYGVTGSGKTTLARRLSEASGIPLFEVDELCWDPEWQQVPLDTQRERISQIVSQDEWIIDSMYGTWLDIPLPRCDLIIGLDYPRLQSFTHLLKRTFVGIITEEKRCNGNIETFAHALGKDSIIAWHFRSFANKRKRLRLWEGDGESPPVLIITSSSSLPSVISLFG
jgi:adenylate kinase family enzyme